MPVNIYFAAFLQTLFFISVTSTKRQISCSFFSSAQDPNVNIIHVVGSGSEDAIHFLWSTYKLPSVIVARTLNDTKVKFDLVKLKSFEKGAIEFSQTPLASTGFVISELLQLSYEDNTAEVEDATNVTRLGLDTFTWNDYVNDQLHCSNTNAYISLKSFSENEVFSKNGSFKIQFSAVGDQQAANEYPHLIYSGNSTQIQITLDNLHSDASRTRYGLELLKFTPTLKSCSDFDCRSDKKKSISDEFSPGIFSDVDILVPCTPEDNEKGSFLTWRPVSYLSEEPSVANSSDAKMTSKCSTAEASNIRSIAELYFDYEETIAKNIFNVTFGTVGDGFYGKTLFTSWSVMVGTGVAIHTTLSVTVIVIISTGLGALALFFLVGGLFFSLRWCRKKNDDLLLSESYSN